MADNKWAQEIEEALSQVVTKPRPKRTVPTLPPVTAPPRAERSTPSPVVVVKRPKKKQESNGFVLGLFFVFLALAVGLAVVLRFKNANAVPTFPIYQNQETADNFLPPTQPQLPPTQPPVQPSPRVEMLEQKVNTLSEATDKIWDRVKQNSDRITLTGTLLNNNFLVESKNLQKSRYIYLNKDWTINRLPDQLTLDAEDREFLGRHLRHGESDAIGHEE